MGHSVKRKEDPRMIRGQGEYIDDVNLPGQLWLDIVRSPYAHATIKGIDATEALKIPGVLAVITGADLEKAGLHWMPTLAGDKQMVLPTDTVMYQSQEVAAVVATTKYIAADGVAAVMVDYEPLPVIVDPHKALEPDAFVLRPDRGPDKQNNHIWHWESGDRAATDADLAAADVHIEQDIYIPRIHVASIETCGCVADWNAVRGQLTLHMTSQAPHAIRTVLALVSGLPEQNIRVKTHDIGGGFGGKVPVYPGYVLAVVASLTVGKPVKWIEDRSENLQADSFARDYHIHAEMGATKDGKITSLKAKTIADHGYTDAAADPSKYPAGLFNVITGSYDFPNAFVEVDGVYTNKPPGGVAYRCSFRVTEAVHAVERMVDILAHEIGKDPAQLRMENFIQPEQFPYKTPTGWSYDSGNYPAALQKAMDTIDYAGLREGAGGEARAWRADGHRHQHASPRSSAPGPSHDFDILGHQDVRLVRDPGPSDRQGHRPARRPEPGPGPRDDLRPDHRRGARLPGRGHQDRGGRHRHRAVRPRYVRLALDPGRRRGDRDGGPQDPGQGPQDRGAPARGERGRPRLGARQVQRQGLAGPVQDDPGDRLRGLHQPPRRAWRPASRRSTTTTRPT